MKLINLDKEPKIESGFKVPEDYFEHFSDKLMTQIPEKEVKVISFFEKHKILIYAAVAVLVIGISIPVLNKYLNKSDEIESLVLENYLANNHSINDNDLAELMSENDIKKIKINMNIQDKTIEKELSGNEYLEDYLIN